LATKSEAEEDIKIVGGIGDDGNLSLLKEGEPAQRPSQERDQGLAQT